jgi:hypothetical protein
MTHLSEAYNNRIEPGKTNDYQASKEDTEKALQSLKNYGESIDDGTIVYRSWAGQYFYLKELESTRELEWRSTGELPTALNYNVDNDSRRDFLIDRCNKDVETHISLPKVMAIGGTLNEINRGEIEPGGVAAVKRYLELLSFTSDNPRYQASPASFKVTKDENGYRLTGQVDLTTGDKKKTLYLFGNDGQPLSTDLKSVSSSPVDALLSSRQQIIHKFVWSRRGGQGEWEKTNHYYYTSDNGQIELGKAGAGFSQVTAAIIAASHLEAITESLTRFRRNRSTPTALGKIRSYLHFTTTDSSEREIDVDKMIFGDILG